MKVQILDEAQQDLVDGYRFYESQVAGPGDYFLDSLLSDIDSLQFHAGIHAVHFGYNRLLSKRFPFAVYSASRTLSPGFMPFWIVGGIRLGRAIG